jgi:Na+/phosphate symporter
MRVCIDTIGRSYSKLLAIIAIVLIAILTIPVIIPHINHTGVIYHISLHVGSVIIAVFLTVVSVIAYRRNRSGRLLFMMGGFGVLALVEFLYLFYATVNIEAVLIPIVDIELSHIILLVMLTLFGIGVLKVNR